MRDITKGAQIGGAKARHLQASAPVCFVVVMCALGSPQLVFWVLDSLQFAFRF